MSARDAAINLILGDHQKMQVQGPALWRVRHYMIQQITASSYLDDFTLASEEQQDVARSFIQVDLHRSVNGSLIVVIVVVLQRVRDSYFILPPRNALDRTAAEVFRDLLSLERG